MRFSLKFFLACILLAMLMAPAFAHSSKKKCKTLGDDQDWTGSKIKTYNNFSGGIDQCMKYCMNNKSCAKWSYSGSKFGNGCSIYKKGAVAEDFSCKCTHAYGTCA